MRVGTIRARHPIRLLQNRPALHQLSRREDEFERLRPPTVAQIEAMDGPMVKLHVPERPMIPGHAGQRWRGGRAVEGSCLENSRAMSSVGSNPTLSAEEPA